MSPDVQRDLRASRVIRPGFREKAYTARNAKDLATNASLHL